MVMVTQRADTAMHPNENQGPTILGATLTVTIAALITTIARLYVRIRMIRNVGWDDYVMLSAMILCVAGQCIIIPEVYLGAGKHIEYIDPEDFKNAFRLNFVTQPIYLFAICLVKLSVGFFLLRIAVKPFYKRLIIGIMSFMGFYTIGCFFTLVLQCTDLRILWDPTVKGACWTSYTLKTLGYVNSAFNISTDIAFSIAIPVPMILSIQMNGRQKASLICILGLGIFATAAAVIKLTCLPNYGHTGDWLWDSRNLTIWVVAESNVGIVAANLPCMKPFFRTVLGSTYGHGSRKTNNPQYNSRPYGPGTKHRSVIRDYASLTSNKTADGEFHGYGAAGGAYMLTTIDAKKYKGGEGGEGSKNSSGRNSPGRKSSSESVTRLNDKANAFSGLGGIAVTTKVDVTESVHSREIYEDTRGHARPQTRDLV